MTIKDSQKQKLTKIAEKDGFTFYEYHPTLFKPLLLRFEPMTYTRRARYLLEYLSKGKYLVYYLAKGDDYLGHFVVAPAKNRLDCAKPGDGVLETLLIEPEKRGNGYSKVFIEMVLEYMPFQVAYGWILKTNIKSIRANEHYATYISDLNIVGALRKPVMVKENGNYRLYKFTKK